MHYLDDLVVYFMTDYSGHSSFSGIHVHGCPRMSVTFSPKGRNQPVPTTLFSCPPCDRALN